MPPRHRRGEHGRGYHAFWTSVFVLCVVLVVGAMYLATRQVDYIWRWNRVPQYFITTETRDIRAQVPGSVAELTAKGPNTEVLVSGDEGQERYSVPTSRLRVARGDRIAMGDVLGTVQDTRMGILTEGLLLTLQVSAVSIVLGIIIGLCGGLARLSENPALRYAALTYVELIRGSPLLVQIYLWYFVFGTLINNLLRQQGLPEIPGLWFGIASMAIFAGAYITEVVRAGIQSIHRGQSEAARSLGMSKAQAMVHVILPQALKRILPPLAGEFIALIKDSSLLGIIAIRELTKATREVVTTNLQPFEMWFTCAILYLLITGTLSYFTRYLEKRGQPG